VSAKRRVARSLTLEEVRALDRGARMAILGIGHLRNKIDHPRHRPKTVDSPLRRDEIAQWVAIGRASHPKLREKVVIARVCGHFGVSRGYVYRILKEVDPERWRIMKVSAAAMADSGMLGQGAGKGLK
jgi:hypothetical protein